MSSFYEDNSLMNLGQILTACACAKISVFYPCTICICGLVDHVTVYYTRQARKLLRHNKMVIRRAKNQCLLEFPYQNLLGTITSR